ncbi:MAG: transposase, partial [Marinobacter sp.]|nr:transposase [Marinobacter sp.]
SLSWFMKCLNESIARDANREDACTGHFWESRFKSQALLTEQALLSCMAYVDLNPVRAAMAETPETSNHTSIKERLTPSFNLRDAIQTQSQQGFLHQFNLPLKPLLHFEGNETNAPQQGVLFSLMDYLSLLDYTGRCIRPGKRGHIPDTQPPILNRLGITTSDWLTQATEFEVRYGEITRGHRDHRRKAV